MEAIKTEIVQHVVNVGGLQIGGGELVVMAGPCAVEDEETLLAAAGAVKEAGAQVLRGGAYKPRTSPKAFQGLGQAGLEMLAKAAKATGLAIVTEVMDTRNVDEVAAVADILQVGSRNMQNTALLKEVGKTNKPVLLKRGMSSTVEEWLLAAEYILDAGNPDVILCERGIRTFETALRNTLDLSAVSLLKELSGLPVVVDPSHGTGKRSLVAPMSRAAVAAGADGLVIEVHPNPEQASCDGPQSLTPPEFAGLMGQVRRVREALTVN
ncbi:3-deoxy-7-phosphoheptulonate synthase [Dethiobacter alkaliphilus]|uniref:3-deoxy-7-phosphoheptulonate synthase n=1 Tax=Dethiobacter alkaliphilus TaxID=427926 RepID=UPI002227800E|nr:3-deoxy-7-phosphoheptulonate synthase [Dethiobacter alkaliphilus]MCW3490769.1 3-deoxy-7-phosphoheptulonate synthase [Dethiobacter alkaliphilus]